MGRLLVACAACAAHALVVSAMRLQTLQLEMLKDGWRETRYTSEGNASHPAKPHGLWNPDPEFLELLGRTDIQALHEHIHRAHTGENWPAPTKKEWGVGEHHWPAFFYEFAPNNVVDLCGGTIGVTKWGDVSEDCAKWVVTNLRCMQTCNFMHRFSGFGNCLNTCSGGPPKTSWCTEPKGGKHTMDEKIVKHCNMFVGRWNACGVSTTAWADSGSWFSRIDKCVYNCQTAMETQLHMGQTFDWRSVKCGVPIWFTCGPGADPFQCGTVNPYLCEGPVGRGVEVCFHDDPWCGDSKWGCYPRPEEGAKTREEQVTNFDGTVSTRVQILNDDGAVVLNATVPKLPYIRPAPMPQWFSVVRPTPFPVVNTPPPGCMMNISTIIGNDTITNLIEGWWNGTSCHRPQGMYLGNENWTVTGRGGPLPRATLLSSRKSLRNGVR